MAITTIKDHRGSSWVLFRTPGGRERKRERETKDSIFYVLFMDAFFLWISMIYILALWRRSFAGPDESFEYRKNFRVNFHYNTRKKPIWSPSMSIFSCSLPLKCIVSLLEVIAFLWQHEEFYIFVPIFLLRVKTVLDLATSWSRFHQISEECWKKLTLFQREYVFRRLIYPVSTLIHLDVLSLSYVLQGPRASSNERRWGLWFFQIPEYAKWCKLVSINDWLPWLLLRPS